MTTRLVAGNDSAYSFVRLKYGDLATDTVSGVIIYPDDFSFAEAGVGMLPFGALRSVTEIDATTWDALQDAGCVFLPGARYRGINNDIPSVNENVYGQYAMYSTATAFNHRNVYSIYMAMYTNETNTTYTSSGRFYGMQIRLVQDL